MLRLLFPCLVLSLTLAGCVHERNTEGPHSDADKKTFRFFINSDPQMGPQDTDKKALGVLNELLEQFVEEVNSQNKKTPIDFVVYNGDLVWDPYEDAFANFVRLVSAQQVPPVLVHGNHDGMNEDPQFLQAQQQLSGYAQLNYSFDYGDWHMVVIAAQEKYPSELQKQQLLTWLADDLRAHRDKPVMLFMHYHILPVGLSQMEFYSYNPHEFKNQLLQLITGSGNVKYVFSGHVHAGIKASIKSTYEYQGTKFVVCPTPVQARPFGEEFAAFENDPKSRFFRRGYYLEVLVDGEDVELVGHKIKHPHEEVYPQEFTRFEPAMDPRFFTPESQTPAGEALSNGSFDQGLAGWQTSFRYQKDRDSAFINSAEQGRNVLQLKAPWGAWNFDEYMETYQLVQLDLQARPLLRYRFKRPVYSQAGAGGYIRLNFYGASEGLEEMLLLHWGHQENRVKFMFQSWYNNADGQRSSTARFEQELVNNNLLSMPMTFADDGEQTVEIDVAALLQRLGQGPASSSINRMSVAHGVWSRLMTRESHLKSLLHVNSVELVHGADATAAVLRHNGAALDLDKADSRMPYFDFSRRRNVAKK